MRGFISRRKVWEEKGIQFDPKYLFWLCFGKSGFFKFNHVVVGKTRYAYPFSTPHWHVGLIELIPVRNHNKPINSKAF
ncbi:hypothetical protein A33Q_2388 [Indibacter alkaliphilus LW1]|uniref:Uncharacterized protein n=1 Tax=Indibacter alkaliphilus (strain CCUG 57479 / KCTC 22604 / LW1) TaxID=1189612 RepID=S2E3A7_INDAL|nr:hypothetical protein A33Q_2388 [Indibacter alkaliphilus LW1]